MSGGQSEASPFGWHAHHFHVDDEHLAVLLTAALKRAKAGGAVVRHELPASFVPVLLRAAAAAGLAQAEVAPIIYHPSPESVRAESLRALADARHRGFRGLWLVVWSPSCFPNFDLWNSAEATWTELCQDQPIAVLCTFPLAGHDDRRLRAMHRHHAHYFHVARGPLLSTCS